MSQAELVTLLNKFGVPLTFALIFMAAIYVMYKDSQEQNQRFIELHHNASKVVDNNTRILKAAVVNWEKTDQAATRQRQQQIDALALQHRTMERWIATQRVNEQETAMRVQAFIFALNRLSEQQGLGPMFPETTTTTTNTKGGSGSP